MRAADISKAARLADDLAGAEMIAARLAAGEPLRLTVGAGPGESEIVLSAAFAAELRRDLSAALALRAQSLRASLLALGVEP